MPEVHRRGLFVSLINLGIRYSEVGRSEDAVMVTREAVDIRRQLAEEIPDRYRPDLAAALVNLGAWYAGVGRAQDALTAAEEAVTIYRGISPAMADRYRPDLARALDSLGRQIVRGSPPSRSTASDGRGPHYLP